MTVKDRKFLISGLYERELSIITTKGFDYSGTEDTLKNFKRNAEILGLTKYQVWLIYFMKHIDAICNSVKTSPTYPTVKSERIDDRILDARVYLGLLECLIYEDRQTVGGIEIVESGKINDNIHNS